jgi:uncharacterized SAM-binding protein YcdF (DUF218 family)
MFFFLSKTVGKLIDPFNLAVMLLMAAWILRRLNRTPRLRLGLAITAAVVLLIFSNGVVANLLLAPLETKYPRPKNMKPPAAIVMLSGVLSRSQVGDSYFEFNAHADRFIEILRLANRFPKATLIFTGGPGALNRGSLGEARILGQLTQELGIKKERILLDKLSRNTYENAKETAVFLKTKNSGSTILITSAFHLPRAVACFKKQGIEVVPWGVDYLRTANGPSAWIPSLWSLHRSYKAIKEYVGMLAYDVVGFI